MNHFTPPIAISTADIVPINTNFTEKINMKENRLELKIRMILLNALQTTFHIGIKHTINLSQNVDKNRGLVEFELFGSNKISEFSIYNRLPCIKMLWFYLPLYSTV